MFPRAQSIPRTWAHWVAATSLENAPPHVESSFIFCLEPRAFILLCYRTTAMLGASTAMAKPKVFATHPLFQEARSILDAGCEVEYWTQPERPPREEILRRVKDKEGLVPLLTER